MPKTLLVCERSTTCLWSYIADDMRMSRAIALREKHYLRHDISEARKAAPRGPYRPRATRATPAAGRDEGSASLPAFTCACCERGLFGIHGVGHVGPFARSVAA
jgi:hypothetical protein